MLTPRADREPTPSARRRSWWLPQQNAWRSPWSMDDDLGGTMVEEAAPPAPPRKIHAPNPEPRLEPVVTPRVKPVARETAPPQPAPETRADQGEKKPPPAAGSLLSKLTEQSPPRPEPVVEKPAPILPPPPPAAPPALKQAELREPHEKHPPVPPAPAAAAPPSLSAPPATKMMEVAETRRTNGAETKVQPPAEARRAEPSAGVPSPAHSMTEREMRKARRRAETRFDEPGQRLWNPWIPLGILAVAAFGITVLAWGFLQDEDVPSEATLRIDRESDPVSAAPAIERLRVLLASVAPAPAEMVTAPPSRWEAPLVARLVQNNDQALANLRDFLEEPDWHPRSAAWFAADLGSHDAWTSLAVLKQAEAMFQADRHNDAAAFQAALDLAELSARLQDINTWPSYQERALMLHERGCVTLALLLKTTSLPMQPLLELEEEFKACAPSDKALGAALGAAYVFEKKIMLGPMSREPLDTLPSTAQPPQFGRVLFKPNKTMRLFIDEFGRLQDEMTRPPYARTTLSAGDLAASSLTKLPNVQGTRYFADRIAPYLDLPARHGVAQARHSVVSALFIIRRFMNDMKRVPRSWADMGQVYLRKQSPPSDPFTGKPLSYDSSSGVVFSVGTNLKADDTDAAEASLSNVMEPAAHTGTLTARTTQ